MRSNSEGGFITIAALILVSVTLTAIIGLSSGIRSTIRSTEHEFNYYKVQFAAESGLNIAKSQLSTIPLWTSPITKDALYRSNIPRPLTIPLDTTLKAVKTATDLYIIASLPNTTARAILKQRYSISGTTVNWGTQSRL